MVMAIQILVMTDDASAVQAVVGSLEERRARVMVHPLDSSLIVLAREVGPAAILLDASGDASNADAIAHQLRRDGGFEGVPIFAIGGVLTDVTASYDDLSQARNASAEILAVAELTHGFQDSDGAGLFDHVDNDLSLDALLGPSQGSKVTPPPVPGGAGRAVPPPLPPPSRHGSVPAIHVRTGSMPAIHVRTGAVPAVPDAPQSAPAAMPGRAGSGRETIALREELNEKDREIIELRGKLVSMERSLFEGEDLRAQLVERIASLESQVHAFEDEVEERQQNIDRLAEALDAQHMQHAEANASADALRASADALRAAHDAAQAERDALAEEAAALRGERDAAIEQQEALRQELHAVREAMAAQEAAAVEGAQERIDALERDYATVTAQRDEALAISQELDTALGAADAQVSAMHERLVHADALIDAMQADLAAYVEAAHRIADKERERLEMLATLASTLQQAAQNVAKVSAPEVGALPATQWESAYNAYVAQKEDPESSDA